MKYQKHLVISYTDDEVECLTARNEPKIKRQQTVDKDITSLHLDEDKVGWLVCNGTFSTTRLHRAIGE